MMVIITPLFITGVFLFYYQNHSKTEILENYKNLTGVNLDEELADMIRYQRAYEASAKVFSVADNMMQIVLNMV